MAHALIDAADAAWANQWRWSLSNGYARRHDHGVGKRRNILLHRELLGLPRKTDGREGDHIDRDRLNDRRSNLRILTKGQNGQNTSSRRGSSQFRGVTWDKVLGCWRAQVEWDGKNHHLGRFDNEEEAAEAARAGRLRRLAYAVD